MLTFIVPLQSPEVSRNWDKVQRLAVRTLGSICNQSQHDFSAVLVCNKPPAGVNHFRNLHLVEHNFPIPEKGKGMVDKFAKLQAGLVYVRQNLPETCFVMIVDADDLVSARLCKYVMANRDVSSGFQCSKGYLYSDSMDYFTRLDKLYTICGSTYIVKIQPEELPDKLDSEATHPLLTHGHTVIGDYFNKLGRPLQPLPFRSVAYVTDTMENDSGMSSVSGSRSKDLGRLFSRVLLSGKARRDFGISK